MNFKKWVKSIQTAGYNGARTVDINVLVVIIVYLTYTCMCPGWSFEYHMKIMFLIYIYLVSYRGTGMSRILVRTSIGVVQKQRWQLGGGSCQKLGKIADG